MPGQALFSLARFLPTPAGSSKRDGPRAGTRPGEETARSCTAAAGKAAPRGNAAGNHTVMKREGAEIGKSGSHPFGEHQQIVRR